jgi:hypothetical protein
MFIAKSSDDSMIKLIFGGIVLAFWLGGALISALNKRIEENKRRARYGQMPAGYTVPPPVPAARSAGFAPPPAKAKRAKPAKRASQRLAAVAPQPPPRPTFSTAAAPAQPAPAAPPRQPSSAPPSQIARLLRRPESLRAAFILNEVLSPPLSVRDSIKDGRRVQ